MAHTYPAGPPPTTITSNELVATRSLQESPSVHQGQRVLQHALERLEESRAGRAVDHPVVAGHREAHPSPDGDGSLVHHRLLDHPADCDDARFRWIDDRREFV